MRVLISAILVFLIPHNMAGQPAGTLRIKVALVDASGQSIPMPRVVLLVSDNPASAEPRRILTSSDGTAEVKLRPGNYTVESDRPIAFQGNAYQWIQFVDVFAGRDTVLDLTATNAEVEPASALTATDSAADNKVESLALLAKWQDSVVELWTPTAHASGFLIDARGLVATNQRVIGSATAVEVQFTPAIKVAGQVVVSDRLRDVAIIWIDPQAVASVQPLALGCALASKPPIEREQELLAIATPLFARKDMTDGTVSRVEPQAIWSDLRLARGSSGGPVFASDGTLIGLTTIEEEKEQGARGDSRVVPINHACEVVAAAENKMKGASAPSATRLPVEPGGAAQAITSKPGPQRPAVSPTQFRVSSSDFEIAFITPALLRAGPSPSGPLGDFGNWSDYVSDAPPVLLVRVTPKFEEGFWTMVARGAAQTQGVALPPMKRFASNFSRMRAYCAEAEVPPIHPFRIERRVAENNMIYEGLYVFDLAAFGTQCASVKFDLYSEKEPAKADTKTVDPKLLQQIRQDFGGA